MDESTVRQHAQAHADAVVAGDLRQAGSDVVREAVPAAQDVMSKLPRPVTSGEVVGVKAAGSGFIARIRYASDGSDATVESTWEEREGRPRITDLRVV